MSSSASQHGESPVAHNIRAARADRGWTQRRLAVEVGVDVMQVSRWERGVTRPSAAAEAKLVELLFDGRFALLYAVPEPEAA
jgi:transcriptional regulator with XRE-family HTH domain